MGEKGEGEGEEEGVNQLRANINYLFSRESSCGAFCTFVWFLDGGEGWGRVGAGEQVEQLQGRFNPCFSRDNPYGAFRTFCLISRWGGRIRERRSRWISCRVGSTTSLQGKIRVGLIVHFFWSLDGGEGWFRGGAGGAAAGQGKSLLF